MSNFKTYIFIREVLSSKRSLYTCFLIQILHSFPQFLLQAYVRMTLRLCHGKFLQNSFQAFIQYWAMNVLLIWSFNDAVRMITECGAVGRMRIVRGNRRTLRKTASMTHYPPQIPHDLNKDRNLSAAVWPTSPFQILSNSTFIPPFDDM
jgi:hypothetical protein